MADTTVSFPMDPTMEQPAPADPVWLLDGLRNGDENAFEALVSRYQQPVYNLVYRLMEDPSDACDVVQEVFLKVFRNVGTFRGSSSLKTWIYRIAVTKSLDEIKKSRRRKRISSLGRIFHLNRTPDIASDQYADTPLIEKENRQILYAAMNKLPDNQRVALTLSKIEGYNNRDIADLLNLSITAVEMLIHRGRKKLAGELENILKKHPF